MLVGVFAVPMAWSYRDRLGRSMTGMLLPDKKIVVVLPFRVIGANKEEGLYSEGVSVVLTSNLAQLGLPDLQVMPSTEVREARIDTVEKARAEFGATLVLSGVVQFSGGQVRASYSLIRTADRRNSSAAPERSPQAIPSPAGRRHSRCADDARAWTATGNAAGTPAGLRHTRRQGVLPLHASTRRHAELPRAGERGRGHQIPDRSRRPRSAVCHCARRPGRASWENFSTLKQAIWLDRAGEACETSASLSPQLRGATLPWPGRREPGRARVPSNRIGERSTIHLPTTMPIVPWEVLDKLERVDEAEAAYLRAIELRPGYWAGYARIAQFYNLRNDYQKAGDYYERALMLSPDNARVLFSLGLVFTNKGQYDRGIEFLNEPFNFGPISSTYNNLGLAYLRARRYNDAVVPLERAFSGSETTRQPATWRGSTG